MAKKKKAAPKKKAVKKTAGSKSKSKSKAKAKTKKVAKKKAVKKASKKKVAKKPVKKKAAPKKKAKAAKKKAAKKKVIKKKTAKSSKAKKAGKKKVAKKRPVKKKIKKAKLKKKAPTKKKVYRKKSNKKKAVKKKAIEPATPKPKPQPTPQEHFEEPQRPVFIDRGKPIPDTYQMDRLVALVRDPHWIFCYWELSGGMIEDLKADRGDGFLHSCAWILRLHRLDENRAEDLNINPAIGNWYIQVGRSGTYQVELGLVSPEGEFISLLASQVIETPSDHPSEDTDEEWRSSVSEGDPVESPYGRGFGIWPEKEGDEPDWDLFGLSSAPGSGLGWSKRMPGSRNFTSLPWSFFGASSMPGSSRGSGGFPVPDGNQGQWDRPHQFGGPNLHQQPELDSGESAGSGQPPVPSASNIPRPIPAAPRPKPSWPAAAVARKPVTKRNRRKKK